MAPHSLEFFDESPFVADNGGFVAAARVSSSTSGPRPPATRVQQANFTRKGCAFR
ncbi:hypothetical protein RGE_27050 [Rubrivivax gelatinosus IL144]|uniref:Uncharacterized protein n=1 Tax=Rubrivivax gelatinosus (strain NBRC 100245 / IL144) TaxID=983917 RepID=I0HSQ7_RUBGI|nr:hypothetical protein RGE_27050 [Rubrivivax gelatinosus IL144]